MKLRVGGLDAIVAVSTGSTVKLYNYVEVVAAVLIHTLPLTVALHCRVLSCTLTPVAALLRMQTSFAFLSCTSSDSYMCPTAPTSTLTLTHATRAIEWNHITKWVFCYGTQGRRIFFCDARGGSKVSKTNCWTSCLAYRSVPGIELAK